MTTTTVKNAAPVESNTAALRGFTAVDLPISAGASPRRLKDHILDAVYSAEFRQLVTESNITQSMITDFAWGIFEQFQNRAIETDGFQARHIPRY